MISGERAAFVTILLLFLATPTASASPTHLDAGPVDVFIVSGGSGPLRADYDSNGTTSNIGDDELNISQNIDRVRLTIDARGFGLPGLIDSVSYEANFRETRFYNDLWPTMAAIDQFIEPRLPREVNETFNMSFKPEGWDANYRVKAGDSEKNSTPGQYEYPAGGYDHLIFPWIFTVGNSDFYIDQVQSMYESCYRDLVELCYGSYYEFPDETLYSSTPRIRDAGYTLDQADIKIRTGGQDSILETSHARRETSEALQDNGNATGPPSRYYEQTTARLPTSTFTPGSDRQTTNTGHVTSGAIPANHVPNQEELGPLILASALLVLLPIVVLYYRIRRDSILKSAIRARIYDVVQSEPGITEKMLAKRLAVHSTTVAYHGRLLEKHGILEIQKVGTVKAYYENGGTFDGPAKLTLAILRSPSTRNVWETVQAAKTGNVSEIARRLGTTRQTVLWHVRKLSTAGLVRIERAWQETRVIPATH